MESTRDILKDKFKALDIFIMIKNSNFLTHFHPNNIFFLFKNEIYIYRYTTVKWRHYFIIKEKNAYS